MTNHEAAQRLRMLSVNVMMLDLLYFLASSSVSRPASQQAMDRNTKRVTQISQDIQEIADQIDPEGKWDLLEGDEECHSQRS